MADPGPIASLFWLDEELQSKIHLDGIVTVVDAKYIESYLNQVKQDGEINEATKQVALADRIILNKTDLVTTDKAEELTLRLQMINSVAPIYSTHHSTVPLEHILDLHCFDDRQTDPFKEINQSHLKHSVDQSVQTVTWTVSGVVNRPLLEKWAQRILWESSVPGYDGEVQVLRLKALLNMQGESKKHILQAVHELYDIHVGAPWHQEERANKIVFIGRHLVLEQLQDSFSKVLC